MKPFDPIDNESLSDEEYQHLANIHLRTGRMAQGGPDKRLSKARLFDRLPKDKRSTRNVLAGLSPLFWYAAAAVALLVFATSLFLSRPKVRYLQSADQHTVASLPNRAEAFLAPNTILRYEKHLFAQPVVYLEKGTATFDVEKRHPGQAPFIVQTGQTEVKVLGTVFQVQRGEEADHVYVLHGKVRVLPLLHGADSTYLTDSESVTVVEHQMGEKFSFDQNQNYFSRYRGGIFFEKAPLPLVLQVLERELGQPFKVDDRLTSCQVTIGFKTVSMEVILSYLIVELGLEIKEQNQTLYLSGPGCS